MQNRSEEKPLVSIIVPCRYIDEYTRETLAMLRMLDYPNYEIIVVPDEADEGPDWVRIIPSGPVSPGKKRNIAKKEAKGDILAYIDSDAYPEKNWLKIAVSQLKTYDAIGGPAVTPPNDDWRRRVSGYIYSSILMGSISLRFKENKEEINENIDVLHSVNFVAKRNVIEEIGGWNEEIWPGEDTLLCSLLRKNKKKLAFIGNMIVYHHRRPIYREHLKQVAGYGYVRGYLAGRFGKDLARPIYFLPAILLLYVLFGPILSLKLGLLPYYGITLTLYIVLTLVVALLEIPKSDKRFMVDFIIGIILTHLTYGFYELAGLLGIVPKIFKKTLYKGTR